MGHIHLLSSIGLHKLLWVSSYHFGQYRHFSFVIIISHASEDDIMLICTLSGYSSPERVKEKTPCSPKSNLDLTSSLNYRLERELVWTRWVAIEYLGGEVGCSVIWHVIYWLKVWKWEFKILWRSFFLFLATTAYLLPCYCDNDISFCSFKQFVNILAILAVWSRNKYRIWTVYEIWH